MWESRTHNPLGRLSMRKYILVAMALLMVCFVYMIASSPSVFAADAQLTNSGITYNNQTYSGPNTATGNESFNLPKNTIYYTYTEAAGTGNGGTTPVAHLIYFGPGVDPSTSTSAARQSFDHPSENEYTNPSQKQTISLEKTNQSDVTDAGGTTSCAVEGIGWIVCPITNFLAKGMDIIYDMVSEFLVVQPLQTTSNNVMYRVWTVMRNIANIAFVIAFMVVIYSQLTSIGLSNYSVKKMLPRIIVAAVLVNTSYWICAVAIDICNILGYSLQDMFINIRNSLVGSEGNSWDVISWESVSSFILSGGALAAAGGIGIYLGLAAIGGVTAAGLIFLFLPLLLSVLFVVLMTFLILAGRQAIITILVILAPLAFVAYLLPNTEKWFEKWRSALFTLLLVFPGFSLVFGGSQLAAAIIIQNANSINVILLAMAVQVMPLAITPLLLKLGGGVLNRFAGIVNNPTKGLFDRGKAWSKDRMEANQAAKMKRMAENPAAIRRFSASRVAYARNQSKRRREAWKSANEATADGHWKNTDGYQRIQQRNLEAGQIGDTGDARAQTAYNNAALVANSRIQQRDFALRTAKLQQTQAETQTGTQWEDNVYNTQALRTITQNTHTSEETGKALKAAVESANEAHWEQHAATDPGMRELRLEHHVDHQQAELAKKQWEAEIKEWASGRRPATPYGPGSAMFNLIAETQGVERAIAIQGMRLSSADGQQKVDIAEALKASTQLQVIAGGVDPNGTTNALAAAESTISRANAEAIKNIKDASDILPGAAGVDTMAQRLRDAVSANNSIAMRAYVDMLADSSDPGIKKLRSEMSGLETMMSTDLRDTLKMHINSSPTINAAAEDIATWSRKTDPFANISADPATWSSMAPAAFAGMKKSSQNAAMDAGGISPQMAYTMYTGPAKQNLKEDADPAKNVLARVRALAQTIDPSLD